MPRRLGMSISALLLLAATSLCGLPKEADRSIPWGAMYVPLDVASDAGMTGVVGYYRGGPGAERLLADLAFARDHRISLIVTMGSVSPSDVLDGGGHVDMVAVHRELDPFLAVASKLWEYAENRTLWGIRFLDEPHDPAGYPPGFEVEPNELAEAYALIQEALPGVPIGSTAPPQYMIRVPGAGLAFSQIVHHKLPPGYDDPIVFQRDQAALAHEHGLLFVASTNANTNPIDNVAFFRTYRQMCAIPAVDFVTSWQWPQGHHPQPSFEARFTDSEPAVQAEISLIPAACQRP